MNMGARAALPWRWFALAAGPRVPFGPGPLKAGQDIVIQKRHDRIASGSGRMTLFGINLVGLLLSGR